MKVSPLASIYLTLWRGGLGDFGNHIITDSRFFFYFPYYIASNVKKVEYKILMQFTTMDSRKEE